MISIKKRVYKKNFAHDNFEDTQTGLAHSSDIYIHIPINENLKKPLLILSIISLIFIVAILGFYYFIQSNVYFAANFADNDLRPLIGEKGTLTVEALFFNMQDQFNQVKYHLQQSSQSQSVIAQISNNTVISGIVNPTQNSDFTLIPILPIISYPGLVNEGKWTPIVSSSSGVLVAKTQFRPDPDRPYAIVNLIKMNMNVLSVGAVAGTQQPGGWQNPGPGAIPLSISRTDNLIAAFNGGFQQKDGYYGMIVGNKTYLPLVQGMATLVLYQNAKPQIIRYQGNIPGTNIVSLRQNGPMLIENSKIVTSENAWNMQTWGLTVTNSMYTWRSGLGVTKDGNLIYAVGPSLVPETLAQALLSAGAVNAMQLDINPVWVRFILFNSIGQGDYTYASVDPNMINGGYEYLHGYQKDFFYVYK